jgi:hypothetical protein
MHCVWHTVSSAHAPGAESSVSSERLHFPETIGDVKKDASYAQSLCDSRVSKAMRCSISTRKISRSTRHVLTSLRHSRECKYLHRARRYVENAVALATSLLLGLGLGLGLRLRLRLVGLMGMSMLHLHSFTTSFIVEIDVESFFGLCSYSSSIVP